jgi:hypothetical protein
MQVPRKLQSLLLWRQHVLRKRFGLLGDSGWVDLLPSKSPPAGDRPLATQPSGLRVLRTE